MHSLNLDKLLSLHPIDFYIREFFPQSLSVQSTAFSLYKCLTSVLFPGVLDIDLPKPVTCIVQIANILKTLHAHMV